MNLKNRLKNIEKGLMLKDKSVKINLRVFLGNKVEIKTVFSGSKKPAETRVLSIYSEELIEEIGKEEVEKLITEYERYMKEKEERKKQSRRELKKRH